MRARFGSSHCVRRVFRRNVRLAPEGAAALGRVRELFQGCAAAPKYDGRNLRQNGGGGAAVGRAADNGPVERTPTGASHISATGAQAFGPFRPSGASRARSVFSARYRVFLLPQFQNIPRCRANTIFSTIIQYRTAQLLDSNKVHPVWGRFTPNRRMNLDQIP